MIIKGIELMQMIAEEKIDKKTKLIFGEECYEFDGDDIVDDIYRYSIFTIYSIEEILRMDFEIIDLSDYATKTYNEINNIKEIEVDEHGGFIEPETKKWKGRKMDVAFANKLNELVRAVNKLNKQEDISKDINCMTD